MKIMKGEQKEETRMISNDENGDDMMNETLSDSCEKLLNTIIQDTSSKASHFTLLTSENWNEKPLIVTVVGGGDEAVAQSLRYLRKMYLEENETSTESFVFGFDTESDRGKVASVQLSTRFLSIVFLLQKMYSGKSIFPRELQKLLEDGRILKTGVGVKSDAQNLQRSFQIRLRGDVDLSFLSVQQGVLSGSFISLKDFAKRLIGLTYSRTHRGVQWSKLDVQRHESMIHYAAMDSFVGYRCTQILASFLCVKGENKTLYEWLYALFEEMREARLEKQANSKDNTLSSSKDNKLLRQAKKELNSEEQLRMQQNRRRYMEIAHSDGSRMKHKLQDKKRKREREVSLNNGMSDALSLLKGLYNNPTSSTDATNNDNHEPDQQQASTQKNNNKKKQKTLQNDDIQLNIV